jgi:hypothetical protein
VREIKRKTEYWSRGTKIAVLELFGIIPNKIWCVFPSLEPSRRRIGEDLMGGSLPGTLFFFA